MRKRGVGSSPTPGNFFLKVLMKGKNVLLKLFILTLPAFQVWGGSPSEDSVSPQFKRRLGVGLAYAGGLVRYGFKNHWSVEAHFLMGKADSNDGDVTSRAMGLRTFRHFRLEKNLQPYAGAEASFVMARSNNLRTSSGIGVGVFTGVEYYFLPRFSIGLDLGPYYVKMTQDKGGDSESGMDFVFNTFLNFYIF